MLRHPYYYHDLRWYAAPISCHQILGFCSMQRSTILRMLGIFITTVKGHCLSYRPEDDPPSIYYCTWMGSTIYLDMVPSYTPNAVRVQPLSLLKISLTTVLGFSHVTHLCPVPFDALGDHQLNIFRNKHPRLPAVADAIDALTLGR